MKKIITILFLIIFAQAEAYVLAKMGSAPLDNNLETHIIIAGESNQAELLFQQAAITKGLKYLDSKPRSQVVFLFQHQGNLKDNVSWLQTHHIQIIKSSAYDLQVENFINLAGKFHAIATLDIFSHSAVSYGSKFSQSSHLVSSDPSLLALKKKFTPEAYIVIHGCNSGFQEAVRFSSIFGIPAFGSLTSTDFQEKLSNGKWYFNDESDKPVGLKVDSNCLDGLCIRMKPINSVYSGYWGSYSGGGLPFYKVFCRNVLPQKCLAAMTRFAMNYVSSSKLSHESSIEEYKKVIQDMLCPNDSSGSIRESCIDKLNQVDFNGVIAHSLKTYSPFRRDQLQCSVMGCEFKFDCSDPTVNNGYCQLINTARVKPTTFVDEYQSYMKAFKYLKYLR